MKALLVDRLGFERLAEFLGGNTIVVPRRLQPGQSHFDWFGPAHRNGEEVIEYRERDDMAEELKAAHRYADHLRSECRRAEGRIRDLESELERMALELHRRGKR